MNSTAMDMVERRSMLEQRMDAQYDNRRNRNEVDDLEVEYKKPKDCPQH